MKVLSPRVGVTKMTVLTLPRVGAVSFPGYARIPTRASPGLPGHLRGAIVELRGSEAVEGHLTAWSSSGKRLAESFAEGRPMEFEMPSQRWPHGQTEPQGVCTIKANGVADAEFRAGGVITQLTPHTDVYGREFVDCARSFYVLHKKWPIEANVLLDATHPGSRPARLLGMRPLPARNGVFVPIGAKGELARRIDGAWLLVGEGKDRTQRLAFLEHLHVTLRLRTHPSPSDR